MCGYHDEFLTKLLDILCAIFFSEEGTEFLRKIMTEENDSNSRCMKRHNLFIRPYHPDTDVKKYCRMDFLDDDDGFWEDEIKKVIIKNLFRPCGPPPSIRYAQTLIVVVLLY